MTTPMAAFAPVDRPLLGTASAVDVGDIVVEAVDVAKVEGRPSVAMLRVAVAGLPAEEAALEAETIIDETRGILEKAAAAEDWAEAILEAAGAPVDGCTGAIDGKPVGPLAIESTTVAAIDTTGGAAATEDTWPRIEDKIWAQATCNRAARLKILKAGRIFASGRGRGKLIVREDVCSLLLSQLRGQMARPRLSTNGAGS